MRPIVIYGNGGQAEMTQWMIENDMHPGRKVAAFTVPSEYINSDTLHGIPVVDYTEMIDRFPPQKYDAFVAVGPQQCNEIRENIYNELKSKGYGFANMIGQESRLANMEIGENVLIDSGSVTHPFSKVGNNCVIINTAFSHHSQVGDHCFLANVMVGGRTVIEDNVFIGINTVLKDNITIGKGSIIGACSLILEDVPPYSVYAPKGTQRRNVDARKISLFRSKKKS